MSDQGSEGLLSPWLRRRRISAAAPFLRGRVLDVGCGSGNLAEHVDPERYRGIDVDAESLSIARSRWPGHAFERVDRAAGWTGRFDEGAFDTICLLAVIEHVPEPARLLEGLLPLLASRGRIVVTTPHPGLAWAHWIGSRIGIFSKAGNEEHEILFGSRLMRVVADAAGLSVVDRRRFLLGANQLFLLQAQDI